MRVTASHIVEWANTNTKQAQTDLPRLIRRLCFDENSTHLLSFPAGDSTYVPGWDGRLVHIAGNAWIPAGLSLWEIGCDLKLDTKANNDYQKRVDQTSPEDRSNATFVFITPRRWIKKASWIAEQHRKAEWADVRAYDADDLEQWLEQSPSVALQFAEELGLSGDGVESLDRNWQCWSQQSNPAITPEALFTDRSIISNNLLQAIQTAPASPIILRADSVEEAVAFAVATLMMHQEFANQALVVTTPQGWRFVDANSQLKIVIAARTEVAITPIYRKGLIVIVPRAMGDLVAKVNSTLEVILERLNVYEFKKALITIGVEESDAKRYALSTGRSWAVFRRQCATNPAIKHPHWLSTPQSASLSMLCLLGAWHSDSAADCAVVAQLAARPYEDIERDLRLLARLDDAPLLCIGAVWKSKSPLELLSLFGEQITREQLDRFFTIAKDMLTRPDPQLELPEKDRYAAQIYGKVHPHSGLLFESICDSLMKLAVRGAELPALQTLNIEDRINGLVRDLLADADGERWLSLASHLSMLAEAAPESFLKATEKSLARPNAPITRLLTETGDSGLMGRCWHAHLLWALETLAWSPRHFARVSLILAQLSRTPIQGNWGNKPSASLFALFRSWLPKTAASLTDRIKVLDILIQKYPDIAFGILKGLTDTRPQTADQAARPKWRDDDAGAGHGVTYEEMDGMITAAKLRIMQLSVANASRIAVIVNNIEIQEQEQIALLLELINPFTEPTANGEDQEIIRDALRRKIHWQRNYSGIPATELNDLLQSIEACYENLSPVDPLLCHRWLFSSHIDLPTETREQGWQATENACLKLRLNAMNEIFQKQGLEGIEHLILNSAELGIIGATLANTEWSEINWVDWIIEKGADFAPNHAMTLCISSFLRTTLRSNEILLDVMSCAEQQAWDTAKRARLLILARPIKETWQLVASCSTEIEVEYWQNVHPNHWGDEDDLEFALERLLLAKRPRTALNCCQYKPTRTKPSFFLAALQQFLLGYEANGRMIDSYHLGEILEYLEQSDEIDRMALVHLEFGLFPILRHGDKQGSKALYDAVMSEPTLFAELITLAYKPDNTTQEEVLTDSTKAAAERAWQILHACQQQPGTQADGSIDHCAFTNFIEAARKLCHQTDRLVMCDYTLGQIFAHAPSDEDGTWPFLPARTMLETLDEEEMHNGFAISTRNKRGVTCRSPLDGGDLERDLAAYYQAQAERIQYSHPKVAATINEISKSYDVDGKREDISARLRREGY